MFHIVKIYFTMFPAARDAARPDPSLTCWTIEA